MRAEKHFNNLSRFYLVGIGGSGMNGIAEILLHMGMRVKGSDIKKSAVIEHLMDMGADIKIGHSEDNIDSSIDVVIYSSAVKEDNPELVKARELRIPTIKRAIMLAELSRTKKSIAIAGTHGKTSTTSMLAKIMSDSELDPTVVVGGIIKNTNTGAIWGKSDYIVIEADEFDQSFLKLSPIFEIITNVEEDHLECYGSFDNIKSAFTDFANKVPFYGKCCVCIDEQGVNEILPNIISPLITYSVKDKTADYFASEIEYLDTTCKFRIFHKGSNAGLIILPVPGEHNVKNATAAVAIAMELGISFINIKNSLSTFSNAKRRFEVVGIAKENIRFIDDYAHHPTEIAATLSAAKNLKDGRIVALFQPHLYSRALRFANEFADSLNDADIVIITDVYGARETPIEGVDSHLIIDKIKKINPRKEVLYVKDKENIPEKVCEMAKSNDIFISLGAGDINKHLKKALAMLE